MWLQHDTGTTLHYFLIGRCGGTDSARRQIRSKNPHVARSNIRLVYTVSILCYWLNFSIKPIELTPVLKSCNRCDKRHERFFILCETLNTNGWLKSAEKLITCYLLQDCYSLITMTPILSAIFPILESAQFFLYVATSLSKGAITTLDSINMYLFVKSVANSCWDTSFPGMYYYVERTNHTLQFYKLHSTTMFALQKIHVS